MLTQRAGDLLHGLNAGPHDLAAPVIEELSGPDGRVVVPELLKGFLQPDTIPVPEFLPVNA
jgi:hypothetical protein